MCKRCNDTKEIIIEVMWSDGLGLATARCPECNPEQTGPITKAEYDAMAESPLAKKIRENRIAANCRIAARRKEDYDNFDDSADGDRERAYEENEARGY